MLVFMIPQVIWLNGKIKPVAIRGRAAMNRGDPRGAAAQRLVDEFAPLELIIEDESHLHAGHAGAAGGREPFSRAHRRRGVSRHARPWPGTGWCTRRWAI